MDLRKANTVPRVVDITARDGITLRAAVYLPEGGGRHPAIFAAAPYRFDNNILPASPQFLWRETGPIDLYVQRGYAYVHLDVRGCGRSEGIFELLGPNEQTDLYDAIEWVGRQDWCSGKVGSIGQSYYCMSQWFLGRLAPPALACIGAHDGFADFYRAAAYHGGIPCDFFGGYWWYQNRFINRYPAQGPSREQEADLTRLVLAHPTLDEFWQVRSAWDALADIKVPLYSVAVPAKHQLHTRGNIDGFRRAKGPRKLLLSGAPNAWAANAEFASPAFHEKIWLPFYDHFLKGLDTDWPGRPAVEYALRGTDQRRHAADWPPPGVQYRTWRLSPAQSGSVMSLNDGSLTDALADGATEYAYPDPGWVAGVVGFGHGGPASGFDPARRVLTFTSEPLAHDIEIAGPIKLVLFAESTADDTDFFVKLSDQVGSVQDGRNPAFEVVSRGWLRASHRALDPARSTEMEPVPSHQSPEPIVPGQVTRFEISIEPNAYLFRASHRIRLEIANGDSPVTEALWPHYYRPDRIGRDTVHHSARYPSHLVLPVTG